VQRIRKKRDIRSLRAGLQLAGSLITGALEHGYLPFALELLLVRAQLHAALGDDLASASDYRRALELGQSEGYISVFVEEGPPAAAALQRLLDGDSPNPARAEYIRAILAAFAASSPDPLPAPHSAAGCEPLTDRELDVLRLMAEGLHYEGIASRLYISLNTVRSHVKAVYGKLGVNNRTKAIEAGRLLDLI
jgi:LuxR family maltose regulon positive regulatory protein